MGASLDTLASVPQPHTALPGILCTFLLIPQVAPDYGLWRSPIWVRAMNPRLYPFAAIVEQESMKTALVLNAVDPSIGGVLIRGQKGTGKSTAARALASLLPPIEVVEGCPFNSDPREPVSRADLEIEGLRGLGETATAVRPTPFVELPLNATEDRLVGSLHIEKALQSGRRTYEPGLLAAANRGILYVDEVNLLDDHLVDVLLDAAASGINVVEREGISFVHPARFILIGTMNPEEGDLRPQFLDRFGLCAAVASLTNLGSRETIVRRHLSFQSDPETFLRQWERVNKLISNRIAQARARLDRVEIPDEMVAYVVRLTQDLQVQGHRADITVLKASRAHAALMERHRLAEEDVAEAVRLAVPHRMKSSPLDSMENLRQRIDSALHERIGRGWSPEQTGEQCREQTPEEIAEQMQVPGSMASGSILFSFLAGKEKETVFEADPQIGAAEVEVAQLSGEKTGTRKKSKAKAVSRRGRYRRALPVREGERNYHIALDATLRRAALRRARENAPGGPDAQPEFGDLSKKMYLLPCRTLIVFVVDASDSMGAGVKARMKAAKGAVLAILSKAYKNRSEVAMVVFGGEKAKVALHPTSSIDIARRMLEKLPTGGATPFADGLDKAWQLVRMERRKNPGLRAIMVIISDGEANVPISDGASPREELSSLAEKMGHDNLTAVFIDAADRRGPANDMRQIAARMQASYVKMRDLTSPRVVKAIMDVAEVP